MIYKYVIDIAQGKCMQQKSNCVFVCVGSEDSSRHIVLIK